MSELSADEKTRAEYEYRLKARRDAAWLRDSVIEFAVETARKDEKIDIAKQLKARGRPLEEIAADTGLDIDSIKKLG